MSQYGGYYFDINGNPTEKPINMGKLSLKQIEELLKQKDIDPTLKESLKEKKKILTNEQIVKK